MIPRDELNAVQKRLYQSYIQRLDELNTKFRVTRNGEEEAPVEPVSETYRYQHAKLRSAYETAHWNTFKAEVRPSGDYADLTEMATLESLI
jgi:hypothetical protein